MPGDDDWTDVLPRVQDPPPPCRPAWHAWMALCIRVTLGLWLATLAAWAWLLVLAFRALYGAG